MMDQKTMDEAARAIAATIQKDDPFERSMEAIADSLSSMSTVNAMRHNASMRAPRWSHSMINQAICGHLLVGWAMLANMLGLMSLPAGATRREAISGFIAGALALAAAWLAGGGGTASRTAFQTTMLWACIFLAVASYSQFLIWVLR